jgi:hypothetical protein
MTPSSRRIGSFRRAGAYVIKSAESLSSRVPSKTGQNVRPEPTVDDKELVAALRRVRREKAA